MIEFHTPGVPRWEFVVFITRCGPSIWKETLDAMMKEIDEDEGLQALSEEASWTYFVGKCEDKWSNPYTSDLLDPWVSRHESVEMLLDALCYACVCVSEGAMHLLMIYC